MKTTALYLGIGLILGFIGGQMTGSQFLPGDHANHQNINSHDHTHDQISVDVNSPLPILNVQAIPDAKDGFNLFINTENFVFTPETINQEVLQNEGHAHVYVNGTKVARVYSNWFHVGDTLFKSGSNEITVTLNANDHSEWAVAGESISQTITVTK